MPGGPDPELPCVQIRRVYDPVDGDEGKRVLIDRLWPRGIGKDDPRIGLWLKDIAPSTELRQWYRHDEIQWPEFCRRYRAELEEHPNALEKLKLMVTSHKVTLVYASRDIHRNHGVALKKILLD